MRQTICEGVLESTTGNTASKEASAFISMSNHMCIIKGKFIVFIKKQLYWTVLFTVNSSCPSVSSWFGKKTPAGKNHKGYRCKGRVAKGSSTLSPCPGWCTLPRACIFSTLPLLLLLDRGCICSWQLQVRTKAWSTPPGFQRRENINLGRMYLLLMPAGSGTPACLLSQDAVWSCTDAAQTSLQPSYHGHHVALLYRVLGILPQKAAPCNKLFLQKLARVSLTLSEFRRKYFKAAFSLSMSYRHIVKKLIAWRQRMIVTFILVYNINP